MWTKLRRRAASVFGALALVTLGLGLGKVIPEWEWQWIALTVVLAVIASCFIFRDAWSMLTRRFPKTRGERSSSSDTPENGHELKLNKPKSDEVDYQKVATQPSRLPEFSYEISTEAIQVVLRAATDIRDVRLHVVSLETWSGPPDNGWTDSGLIDNSGISSEPFTLRAGCEKRYQLLSRGGSLFANDCVSLGHPVGELPDGLWQLHVFVYEGDDLHDGPLLTEEVRFRRRNYQFHGPE